MALTEGREALRFRPWSIKFILSQQTNPCAPLHKIWLTQETDAKSWSSLRHVQPKRGAKGISTARN